MPWKQGERNESNAGYAAYIGRKRVGWSLVLEEVVAKGREAIQHEPTKGRFVPPVVIFDCAHMLSIAFITDDSDGLEVHWTAHPVAESGRSLCRHGKEPE